VDRQPKGYENCWEYWNCSEDMQKNCPVYGAKAGKECWVYTDNLKVFDWVSGKRGFDSCFECPWYKYLNKQKLKEKSEQS